MIVLDTHIWVWWVHGSAQLTNRYREYIESEEANGLGISVISLWEVAKLVERRRLDLPMDISEWMKHAISYPGMRLLELTPEIAVESTRLPGNFHRDPADQIIVATARIYDCPLVTADERILNYLYIKLNP